MKKLFLLLILVAPVLANAQVYKGSGSTQLKGEAPLETITAKSSGLQALLNIKTGELNFRQDMSGFAFSQGAKQKQHAEDQFFEVASHPYASFKGKILNDIDFTTDRTYKVTVKGTMSLHGVEEEVKIPGEVKVEKGKIYKV